jgi:hypothetical protein
MWLVVGLWERRNSLRLLDRTGMVKNQGSPQPSHSGQTVTKQGINPSNSRLAPLERYVRLLGVSAFFGVALLAIGVALGPILRFIPEAASVALILVGLMSIGLGLWERRRVLELVGRGRLAVDENSASTTSDRR